MKQFKITSYFSDKLSHSVIVVGKNTKEVEKEYLKKKWLTYYDNNNSAFLLNKDKICLMTIEEYTEENKNG